MEYCVNVKYMYQFSTINCVFLYLSFTIDENTGTVLAYCPRTNINTKISISELNT